jgi:hypothetical protein
MIVGYLIGTGESMTSISESMTESGVTSISESSTVSKTSMSKSGMTESSVSESSVGWSGNDGLRDGSNWSMGITVGDWGSGVDSRLDVTTRIGLVNFVGERVVVLADSDSCNISSVMDSWYNSGSSESQDSGESKLQ